MMLSQDFQQTSPLGWHAPGLLAAPDHKTVEWRNCGLSSFLRCCHPPPSVLGLPCDRDVSTPLSRTGCGPGIGTKTYPVLVRESVDRDARHPEGPHYDSPKNEYNSCRWFAILTKCTRKKSLIRLTFNQQRRIGSIPGQDWEEICQRLQGRSFHERNTGFRICYVV